MHDLQPLSALAGRTPQRADIGTVTLYEEPNVALASVAARLGQEEACAKALQDLIGAPPPGPGKAALGTPYDAFWTGPDQWMISAPHDSHEDIAAEVKSAVGDAGSVTEQTDAWVAFDMIGPGPDKVLERLCPLDMQRLGTGDAHRTRVDHLGCYVIQRAHPNGLRILGPRSAAASLFHAITTAMRSVA